MALRTTTATLALVLLVTGAAQAQWGGDDRRAPGTTMVVTMRDGRETRITVADIASIRFEGGGASARPAARAADWIGSVWDVDEGGWRGVWTRVGDSNRFKAVWRNSDGAEQRDELVLESVNGDKVVFFRESKRGRYRITLSLDRTRIFHGTADWYRAGDTFSGLIRE